jgi:predicted glycosyltransferase
MKNPRWKSSRQPAMRVWIDILTPKQANLFSVFVPRLEENGHEIFVTTRHYREVEQLLQIRGMEATIIGRHGGADLPTKLAESSKRITELAEFVSHRIPDLTISYCSPEAARVAYGLRIPHYAICDSPHAEAVCRLTLPLSRKLFASSVIPKSAWKQYGVISSDMIQYNALDPAVWIREYSPAPDLIEALGLGREKPIVVLRPEEEYASYLETGTPKGSIITQLAKPLSELGTQVIVLPRYEKQVEMLTNELANIAFVLPNVVDAMALYSRCSVFIGAGGTMSAEAALMGVPTISCYPSEPTYVDRFLFKRKLAERVLSVDGAVGRVRRFLMDPKIAIRQKQKADRVLTKMQDPLRVIMTHLGL